MKRIYMDTAAATPLSREVKKEMEKNEAIFGNPGSIHKEGILARRVLDEARKTIAQAIGARSHEVIFTSGGTEGNNLAILGTALASPMAGRSKHIITSSIEHPSVLEPIKELKRRGYEVTFLKPDKEGLLSAPSVAEALREDTILVSISIANNEIGVIEPIRDIGLEIRKWREKKKTPFPYFHSDCCQAPRFLPLQVDSLGVDMMTVSGAKIYGPPSVGFLYVKSGIVISPIMRGGGQEGGLRPGTEKAVEIAGLAKAMIVCERDRKEESKKLSFLRDYFLSKLIGIKGVSLNGHPKKRLPNNVNVSFHRCSGEYMVIALDNRGIAVSTGSACKMREGETSYVIQSLNKGEKEINGATRFTLGRNIKKKDIDYAVSAVSDILKRYIISED